MVDFIGRIEATAERLFNRNRTVAIGIKVAIGAGVPTDRNGAMRAEAVTDGTCPMSRWPLAKRNHTPDNLLLRCALRD